MGTVTGMIIKLPAGGAMGGKGDYMETEIITATSYRHLIPDPALNGRGWWRGII
jgi:hypothetical protein